MHTEIHETKEYSIYVLSLKAVYTSSEDVHPSTTNPSLESKNVRCSVDSDVLSIDELFIV